MAGTLEDRAALITGATGPIGLAIARALAEEGCALHLADRDEAALAGTADVLREAFGVDIEVHPANLRDRVEVDVLALGCDDVDILVICPGKALEDDPEGTVGEGWEDVVFGPADLMREMASIMTERGEPGLIVAVTLPDNGTLATRAANGVLRITAEHLDDAPNRVLALAPEGAATAMVDLAQGDTA